MRNGVQLITYADRLGGGGIDTIGKLFAGPLDGVFTGVHVLPFFTAYDGADAGFDPTDHREVDPRLGDWGSVARLAATHDVTADLIANHVSDGSPQFLDFLAHGDDSQYAGMFLDLDTVFPNGPTDEELALIYRPRPWPPFTPVTLADGSVRRMWTTFTPHQIDIDTSHPEGWAYLMDVLDRLAAAGVAQVRLDAVGYAVKTAGTSCFMTPDTHRFIGEVADEVRARGMESLLEIHSHYADQLAIAGMADRIYDFALPPLILHALTTGTSAAVRRWLESSPRNVITVLDTHDGIGVIDVGPDTTRPGLLDPAQIDELVEGIHAASDGESRLATGAAASNLDLYQVNCTYYSALGCDDDRYLVARLIQLFSPGIPQVYYAGLLAASNDLDLLERTRVGRDINRPYYSRRGVEAQLQRPVVRHLMGMCRFRNRHPAFDGEFSVDGSGATLSLEWRHDDHAVGATVDMSTATFEITSTENGATRRFADWAGFEADVSRR
jgi:sucrose phosphorylase